MTKQYPTEEELEKIRKWNPSDLHGLMEFIKPLWAFGDWGWKQDGDIYHISTGGWSGNEDIIEAMMDNQIWWALNWEQSNRGGHYILETVQNSINRKLKNK